MTYYVYAIQSLEQDRIYVGMTQHLEERIRQHNAGNSHWTKRYRPWKLIYSEKAPDRITARQREKFFKSGIGREQLKTLSAGLLTLR